MPYSLPTLRDVHPDAALTDFANNYGQDLAKDYVADQAATIVKVQHKSDKYFVWDKADIFRTEMQQVADGDPAPLAGPRVSTSNYDCQLFKLATKLTDHTRKNADFNVEQALVKYLMGQTKQKRDDLYATEIFKTGVWTANTEQTGVAAGPGANQFLQWDVAASTPLKDIQNQMQVVRGSTGRTPNVAVTSARVMLQLQRHADILDLYKHTKGGIPTEVLVAQALGLDKIVVGRSIKNTANENLAATMADIWGKHFLLLYNAPSASPLDATAVAGFSWADFDKVSTTGASVRIFRDEPSEADIIEAKQFVDFKIVGNDLGVMMLSAIG